MPTGLLSGLFAAFLMALAFLFSSYAVRKHQTVGSIGILLRAHIIMGIISIPGLFFIWRAELWTETQYYMPVTIAGVLFYLIAQGTMFVIQKQIDSSRIVPLLGLKLIILAIINGLILHSEIYGIWQYLAIACTILSAFLLNKAGAKISVLLFFYILITCTGYSLSDTFLRIQIGQIMTLGYETLLAGALTSTFLCYFISGVISVILFPCFNHPKTKASWGAWGSALPFSLCWITSIVMLLVCFAQLGTVNGNIIQSTRGMIAILIGGLLAKLGYYQIEKKITALIFYKRLFAGFLMILAIYLFTL